MEEDHANRVPVLVTGLPRLTGQMLAKLLDRNPVAVVHRHTGGDDTLAGAVDALDVRVLIVGAGRLRAAQAALDAHPALKVLMVADGGEGTELYEFVPHRRWLGQVSAEILERALRDAARWPPVWEQV